LTAVCRDLDGRSRSTILTGMIAKKFRLKNSTDIIAAVYSKDFNIPSITPLVFDAMQKGDAAASEIVQRASSELAEHIHVLTMRFHNGIEKGSGQRVPLSFIGGLIANETPLAQALRRQISDSFPHIDVVAPKSPPVYGAVLMALA